MESITNKLNNSEISETYIQKMFSLKEYILTKKLYTEHTIDSPTARKYKGDFKGLLRQVYDQPEPMLFLTMILNNLSSSEVYDGKEANIKIPDPKIVLDYTTLIS